MTGIRNFSQHRILITRVVFLYYLLFLLWRGVCHLLPFQLESPAITEVNYDPIFMFVKWSGFPGFIVTNYLAGFTFSAVVIVLCALVILFPRNKLFIILFSILFFLLAIIFNIYLCHGSHYLAGMVLISFAFWPREDDNFNLLWDGMRYYVCWIYGSAFLWKLALGSFFQWDAGILTFKVNLAGYLYQNPETAIAHVYYFFLQHPVIVNIGHKIVVLVEGIFLIGFFTRRYDNLLIALALLVFSGIYSFSDVFFIELQIMIFALLSDRFWTGLGRKVPVVKIG